MQELPVKAEDEEGGEKDHGAEKKSCDRDTSENDSSSSGSYYYDDAYGYEDYDPEEDEGSGAPEKGKD